MYIYLFDEANTITTCAVKANSIKEAYNRIADELHNENYAFTGYLYTEDEYIEQRERYKDKFDAKMKVMKQFIPNSERLSLCSKLIELL